jgi:hypothetical protein
MSEKGLPPSEVPGSNRVDLGELFAAAQTPDELREQIKQIDFAPGDTVKVIVPGGARDAQVTAVESRRSDSEGRDIKYITVVYQDQIDPDGVMGTVQKTETFRADELAQMQVPETDVERVSPDKLSALDGS